MSDQNDEGGEYLGEQCTYCDRPVFTNCDRCGWAACAMHIVAIDGMAVCAKCREGTAEQA